MGRQLAVSVATGCWGAALLLVCACTPSPAPGPPSRAAPGGDAPASSPVAYVTTEPPGATVFVNGKERGKSPLDAPLVADKSNAIKVQLDGYLPAEVTRTPIGYERTLVSLALKRAARLQVKTDPPGARVLAGRTVVLDRTPGTTAPLAVGEVEVLVLLDGHQAQRRTLVLPAGDTALEVPLVRGVKLTVTSTPPQADVLLDGAWVGTTPAEVFLPPKGRHLVEVKKEGWGTAKQVFAKLAAPATFDAKLEDVDRAAARKVVERAQARHDALSRDLDKVQAQVDAVHFVPEALERRKEKLERDLEEAANALEQAERELQALGDAPAAGGPPEAPEPE